MIIKPFPCLVRHLCQNQRRSISDYNIFAAVCLERQPIIAPELNIVERTIKQYLAKVEDINSIYSDHEMRHLEDLKRAERLATQTKVDEKDVEAATKQTAQDFVDQCQRQFAEFTFGPKSFGSVVENDLKSMDRRLDQRLLLMTKIKLGKDFKWLLPFSEVKNSETLIQAAHRTLTDCFRSSMDVTFLGSSPTAVYKYKYPKKIQSGGKKGGCMFIFKSFVASGSIGVKEVNTELIQDYCWLTNDEMKELLLKENQEAYWKSLGASFLEYPMTEEVIKKVLSSVRRSVTREKSDVTIEIKKQN